MHTCPTHCRSFQLHRRENCHRIDQTGSRRAPFDLLKCSLHHLICPFKRKSIPWKFGCSSQGITIGNIIIQRHQSIRWKIVLFNPCCKIFHRIIQFSSCHHTILHHFKSLIVQPFHLFLSGIFKIYSICFYQRKCIKTYMPFCCDLIV